MRGSRLLSLLTLIACAICTSACTSNQVIKSTQFASVAALHLGVAILEAKNDDDDEYIPGQAPCNGGCKQQQKMSLERQKDEIKRQEGRRKSAEFQRQFDDFMEQLEAAEQVSINDSPPVAPNE